MMQISINGGCHRYLSELPEFKNVLPFGVINKTKTDVGGTYVAANCDSNYIIVCPFRDLVDSIVADKNNKYNIFKCYGGTREYEFKKYLKDNATYKVAVTYDSLPKLLRWMDNTSGWKVLVDEYHLILEDMDFRYNAIDGLLNEIKKFEHYTFLSATPIDFEFEIDFLKQLPHYKVNWDESDNKIIPMRYRANSLTKGLTRMIQIFLTEGFNVPDVNGNLSEVKELYIFLNSVTTIKQIVDTVKLKPEDVKICCATRIRNTKILGENYEIESVSSPNKKINFFTKKCFQGCNIFTNNGLIIVASDAYKTQTLVDISTTLEQIAGRLRFNNEYQNIFRNTLIHIYSTNKNVMDDAEFATEMDIKRDSANILISGYSKLNKEERELYGAKLEDGIENELVSIIDGEMIFNALKEQSFIYKQELRKKYRDGFTIRKAYEKAKDKFIEVRANIWDDFNVKLAKAITISYEQLLKDYLDNPSDTYELEYPEFPIFKKYLKESEMNSLRWNKDKMLKAVEDKKLLDMVYLAVYTEGFIKNSDLKAKFDSEFKKRGINLSPKASLIESCNLYDVKKIQKKIDGKVVRGYEMKKFPINFRL